MDSEPGDFTFESKLDEASQKKAKEELNELNKADREIAVQTFRKWINEQDWLSAPTDFGFLLRFLRARKFSQLGARHTFENYWACRTSLPEYFKNIDPADENIQAVLKLGIMYSPTKCDKHGRRLYIGKLGSVDMETCKKFGLTNLYRAFFLIIDWLAYDENVQVNGLYILSDYTDLSYLLMMYVFPPSLSAKYLRYFMKALPARIKSLHNYNEPTFMEAVMGLFFPFMTQKTRERFVHDGRSLVNIYEDTGLEVLPREYLPDDYNGPSVGTTSEVIDAMIADMNKEDFKAHIKALSSDKYGVDTSKRRLDSDAEVASYRKLNV